MKSYNHLWEKLIAEENIIKAINNSSKGKRKRKSVRFIYDNKQKVVPKFQEYADTFKNSKHTPMEIYDGISRKKRTIIVPKYKEQVIHHMVVNAMMPIFFKGMYQHSYGSIPNRGLHKGKKYIEK